MARLSFVKEIVDRQLMLNETVWFLVYRNSFE